MKAKRPYLAAVSAAAIVTSAIHTEAQAFRKFLNQFTEHYESNGITIDALTNETSCGLCHVRAGGGGRRTSYGEDFRNIALDEDKGFPGIEFVDSDSDGFNNLEEIFLQVHPGQAQSTPQQRIEIAISGQNTLIVNPNGNCSELELKAFGFSFGNGQAEYVQSNLVNTIDIPLSGETGAILAKCEAEGAAGSLLVK